MKNISFAIPTKILQVMRKHPEVKWSELARQAIDQKVRELKSRQDPFRAYAYKRWAEEWDDADDIIKY